MRHRTACAATGLGKGSLGYNFVPGRQGGDGRRGARRRRRLVPHRQRLRPSSVGAACRLAYPGRRSSAMFDAVTAYFRSGRRVCLQGAFALGRERDLFAETIDGYFGRWISSLAAALRAAGHSEPAARQAAVETVAGIQGAIVLSRAMTSPELFEQVIGQARARLAAEAPGPAAGRGPGPLGVGEVGGGETERLVEADGGGAPLVRGQLHHPAAVLARLPDRPFDHRPAQPPAASAWRCTRTPSICARSMPCRPARAWQRQAQLQRPGHLLGCRPLVRRRRACCADRLQSARTPPGTPRPPPSRAPRRARHRLAAPRWPAHPHAARPGRSPQPDRTRASRGSPESAGGSRCSRPLGGRSTAGGFRPRSGSSLTTRTGGGLRLSRETAAQAR